MEISEGRTIPASREAVWQALNDTEILRQAMPGCESFEEQGENEFLALITTKVGPVKAKFKFKVTLTDVDAPNGYTLNGEGQGGAAGFARGSAVVSLAEDAEGTLLNYSVKASVGGKLAQLGARLIDGTAKKMADAFFSNFIAIVSGETSAAEPAADSAS